LTLKIYFESPIFSLCDELAKLGKASQDAYNPGGWLILNALLKNGVAECDSSEVNDFKLNSTLARKEMIVAQ
jgi:hypothetical protein